MEGWALTLNKFIALCGGLWWVQTWWTYLCECGEVVLPLWDPQGLGSLERSRKPGNVRDNNI